MVTYFWLHCYLPVCTHECIKNLILYDIYYYPQYCVCPWYGREYDYHPYLECPYCGASDDDPPKGGIEFFPELHGKTSPSGLFPELWFSGSS